MYYAVVEQHGAAWDRSRPLREQAMWADHAAFMDALTAEGVVVLGGPLAGGALLIIDAESEEVIRARLADDPWVRMGLLSTASVERWEILLGDITRG
jgi:uncharacterized protein